MLDFHINNLKKHIEVQDGKNILNRNKMSDSFAFDISLTIVTNAVTAGKITSVDLMERLLGK